MGAANPSPARRSLVSFHDDFHPPYPICEEGNSHSLRTRSFDALDSRVPFVDGEARHP